ncbi:MAG: hypothetical protein ABJC89_10635, partial [Acidobacteriota bacterium]
CLSPDRTAAFIRERLSQIGILRQPPEPPPVAVPEPVLATPPAPAEVTLRSSDEALAAPEPIVAHAAMVDRLADELDHAHRDATAAEQMLIAGIPFATHSRFGWPGQLVRAAVLRMVRPYVHFEARAHRQHLQSTLRTLECLRRLQAEMSTVRDGQNSREDVPDNQR